MFPTLYKKNKNGSIQYWKISVVEVPATTEDGVPMALPDFGKIVVEYGQVGTDSPQVTVDLVTKGKNPGRKNATTAVEQAVAEAKARHKKQLDKGYVADKAKAEKGVDEVEGGVPVMLATDFSEDGAKVQYPALVQPKLDGMRCIAIIENGTATLWSRGRKPIHSSPHVVLALQSMFPRGKWIIDGELYNHQLRAGGEQEFEDLMSLARKKEPAPGHEKILYYIYDAAFPAGFRRRYDLLKQAFMQQQTSYANPNSPLVLVPVHQANSAADVKVYHDRFVSDFYEGAMVRAPEGEYHHSKNSGDRSLHLQKVKIMKDAEAEIVSVKEGRGKMAGKAVFVCKLPSGVEFDCKMEGPLERLKAFWDHPETVVGKQLTFQYQNFTTKGKPRFPVGLRLREEE